MQALLRDISQIRFGYYSQLTAGIGIPYLQVRQFDDSGNLIANPDTFLKEDIKSTSQLLNDGDIIFAGKGNNNFAWGYHNEYGPAIASSTFFVITPDKSKVLPEFLVAYINHSKSQSYFQQFGLGTNIKSIRKDELGEFIVPILPLLLQAKIAAMYNLNNMEINLTLQLLRKKNELYETVINKLTNS